MNFNNMKTELYFLIIGYIIAYQFFDMMKLPQYFKNIFKNPIFTLAFMLFIVFMNQDKTLSL